MSEDKTQDIGAKYDTRPTIVTVLERINSFTENFTVFQADVRDGFARIERRLEDFDVRLDRMEADVTKTRSEMLTLRADFKELRGALHEHFPALR